VCGLLLKYKGTGGDPGALLCQLLGCHLLNQFDVGIGEFPTTAQIIVRFFHKCLCFFLSSKDSRSVTGFGDVDGVRHCVV